MIHLDICSDTTSTVRHFIIATGKPFQVLMTFFSSHLTVASVTLSTSYIFVTITSISTASSYMVTTAIQMNAEKLEEKRGRGY